MTGVDVGLLKSGARGRGAAAVEEGLNTPWMEWLYMMGIWLSWKNPYGITVETALRFPEPVAMEELRSNEVKLTVICYKNYLPSELDRNVSHEQKYRYANIE